MEVKQITLGPAANVLLSGILIPTGYFFLQY